MRRVVAIVLLIACAAHAAGPVPSPSIGSMLPPNHQGLVPQEGKAFYLDWRKEAIRYAQFLNENEELRRAVGEPLDKTGILCVLWMRLRRAAEDGCAALAERPGRGGRAPDWAREFVKKAEAGEKKHCDDPGNDDNGNRRAENLGRRYLRELARTSPSVVREMDEQVVLRAAQLAAALGAGAESPLAPAAAGARGGVTVPLLGNPDAYAPSRLREPPDSL